ncbi:MAG: DUF2141 domain-containing protein [Sphingomonadales bacterium]|nr:DUF2141 domain-containing protein [Sphingomonadales bacterium]
MNLPKDLFRAVSLTAALACASTGSAARAQTAPAGCTWPASNTWIEVVVDGFRNGDGLMAITLYPDKPRKFLIKNGSLYVTRVKAQAGVTSGCIFVPKPGVYAIAIYHDENANEKIDRSALGLPEEGFGFSNNPSTLAGLPAFRSVRLSIPRSGLVTRIRLKYP